MASLVGHNLGGRYQILAVLGEGGMATVYKAYDSRLEREVAIKVIRRGAFPEEEMDTILRRFEREAKALAKLSHPNIVGVIDYGEYDGSPYLVMVYLPGGTLKDLLGAPIRWQRAVQLIVPIARALEYVHERNVINRDVKPSNILMTENGEPMLSDFGLVKLFESEGKESTHLTSSGSTLGTPDYMAPEQWTGVTTVQSDLYSLGVVLYEMITGHKPYTADTPAGILLKQASEPLPLPKKYVPDLPQDMESILLKVLAREPHNRYPSVRAFADELQNLLAGREVSASTIKAERLREQMTGKAERISASSQPEPLRRKKILRLGYWTIGVIAILASLSTYWMANSNGMTFSFMVTRTPIPTQPGLPEPSSTPILPTASPTEALPPTEAPIPSEILDIKRVAMLLIPAGEFTMGNDDGDVDSRPSSVVNVETFYIDKFEVTNKMYDACVYAVKCRKPLQSGSATRSSYYNNSVYADYPVIFVDWKMAKAYCQWREARLPTEAEWEKAARGTDGRGYPWGADKVDCSFGNFSGCNGDTSPVDLYESGQSPYGVYGMAGNVWEWTSSLFKSYPYNVADGRENQDVQGNRIARGGSWHEFGGNGGNVRTDTRFKLDQGYYGAYVGFRCARTP